MGDSALAKQLGIPREQAASFIAAYFERYAGVARFMEKTRRGARARARPCARCSAGGASCPTCTRPTAALRFEAERIAQNTPIQGTAADILKIAMVRARRATTWSPGARMVLTVHDELVFEVPEARAKDAGEQIREAMAGAMKLSVPLVVDVGSGASWARAH